MLFEETKKPINKLNFVLSLWKHFLLLIFLWLFFKYFQIFKKTSHASTTLKRTKIWKSNSNQQANDTNRACYQLNSTKDILATARTLHVEHQKFRLSVRTPHNPLTWGLVLRYKIWILWKFLKLNLILCQRAARLFLWCEQIYRWEGRPRENALCVCGRCLLAGRTEPWSGLMMKLGLIIFTLSRGVPVQFTLLLLPEGKEVELFMNGKCCSRINGLRSRLDLSGGKSFSSFFISARGSSRKTAKNGHKTNASPVYSSEATSDPKVLLVTFNFLFCSSVVLRFLS